MNHSSNVIIHGGTFNSAQGDLHIHNRNSESGLHDLKLGASLGAIHDSAERYPPPNCHPDTRKVVRQIILDWILNENSAFPFLWLYGPAGAGKTAILQAIAEFLSSPSGSGQNFAGSFFFSRGKTGRDQGHFLFPTIAYQLALNVPGLRQHVNRIMKLNPTLHTKSMGVQLQTLIVDAFQDLSPLPQHPYLVIVDGLDECHEKATQQLILRLLCEAIMVHKLPLRFLIGSRPESYIRDSFDQGSLYTIILDETFNPGRDIRVLLQDGFAKIYAESSFLSHMGQPWPREGVIDLLVQRSSSKFIYAATVLKFVGADFWNPTKQLALVLKPDPTTFSDFDQLYIKILSVYPSTKNIVQVLGIFMAFDEEDLTPEVIEDIIKMEEDELKLVLRDLSLMEDENGEWLGNVGDLRQQGQNMLVGKLIEMLRRSRTSGGTAGRPRPIEGLAKPVDDARKNLPIEGIAATITAGIEGTTGRPRPIARPVDDARRNLPTEGIAATIAAGVEGIAGRPRPILARPVDDARKNLPTEGIAATITAEVEGTTGRPRPALARPVNDARKNLRTEGMAATITAEVEGTAGRPRPTLARPVDDARKKFPTERMAATITAEVEGTAGRPRPTLPGPVEDARKNLPAEGMAPTITAGAEGTAGRPRPPFARPVDDARKNLPTEGIVASITAGVEGTAGRPRPTLARPVEDARKNFPTEGMAPIITAGVEGTAGRPRPTPARPVDDARKNLPSEGMAPTITAGVEGTAGRPRPLARPVDNARKNFPTEGMTATITAGVEGTAGRPRPTLARPVDDARKKNPTEGIAATVTAGAEGTAGQPRPATPGWVVVNIATSSSTSSKRNNSLGDGDVTKDVKRSAPSSFPPPFIAASKRESTQQGVSPTAKSDDKKGKGGTTERMRHGLVAIKPSPILARLVNHARKNLPTERIAATTGVEGISVRPRPIEGLAKPVDDARKKLPSKGEEATITAGVEGTVLGFEFAFRGPPGSVPSNGVLVQVWAVGVDGVDGILAGVNFGGVKTRGSIGPSQQVNQQAYGQTPSTSKQKLELLRFFSMRPNNAIQSSSSKSPQKLVQRHEILHQRTIHRAGYIPGRSFVGRVLECGLDEKFMTGEWVVGLLDIKICGALTEFIVVDQHRIHRVPHPRNAPHQEGNVHHSNMGPKIPFQDDENDLSLEELALLPLCGIPAYRAVRTFINAFSPPRHSPITVHDRNGSTATTEHPQGRRRRVLVLRGHEGVGAVAVQLLAKRGWEVSMHAPFSSTTYDPTTTEAESVDPFSINIQDRARGWGADEIIFDGQAEDEIDDGRMAATRVMESLREKGDVFDAILDTVGGKEVREAGERLLRSAGVATATRVYENEPLMSPRGRDKPKGVGHFTTVVGDAPERPIPTTADHFRAGLRSIGFESGAKNGNEGTAADMRGNKVGYAWVKVAQEVDWEGEDISETLSSVLRLALEEHVRPVIAAPSRIVPFEQVPNVFVDKGPLGHGCNVVVKIAG